MKIIINGKPLDPFAGGRPLDYDDICLMAGYNPEKNPTVTWRNGQSGGTIRPGGGIAPANGMIFNVANTGNA